jgi:hypothetical protein
MIPLTIILIPFWISTGTPFREFFIIPLFPLKMSLYPLAFLGKNHERNFGNSLIPKREKDRLDLRLYAGNFFNCLAQRKQRGTSAAG